MELEMTDILLSKECMNEIPIEKYAKDFMFIVNGKCYETSRIIADILSPKIRKLHFIDQSINEFIITTKSEKKKDYFIDFLNLATFNKNSINTEQKKIFSEYFYKLGNIEEYCKLQKEFISGLKIKNVIGRLLSIIDISSQINEEIDFNSELMKNIINFIAINFESIDKNEMKQLKVDVIENIILNESLKINNEDSLIEFILFLCEDDFSYSTLFEFVLFENISEDIFNLFLSNFNILYLNESIWRSICSCFKKNTEKDKKQNSFENKKSTCLRNYIEIKDFSYQEGKELQGIMNYLSIITGGNIHDNGTIEITSNSINYKNQEPKNLVDYNDDNYYCSTDEGNAFICFDFKDKLVQLTGYSIQSRNHSKNYGHLKNWVIEASEDGESWIEIDCHSDDPTLNNNSVIAVFDVNNANDFYRFIRLRQTGKSWSKYGKCNRFYFPFMEFFGKIKLS